MSVYQHISNLCIVLNIKLNSRSAWGGNNRAHYNATYAQANMWYKFKNTVTCMNSCPCLYIQLLSIHTLKTIGSFYILLRTVNNAFENINEIAWNSKVKNFELTSRRNLNNNAHIYETLPGHRFCTHADVYSPSTFKYMHNIQILFEV